MKEQRSDKAMQEWEKKIIPILTSQNKVVYVVILNRPVVGPLLKQTPKDGEGNFVVKKGEDTSQWDELILSRSVG